MSKNRIILLHNIIENVNINKDIGFFTKLFPDLMIYSNSFDNLYKGRVYNPPFFNIIIYIDKTNKGDRVKMLFNMLLSGGYLIILKSGLHFDINIEESQRYTLKEYDKNKKYVVIRKNKPIIHILNNKQRIIDIMIIGVQKGGTSAAMTNLEKHPSLNIHYDEVHYYENDWIQYDLEKYKSKFDYNKKLVGEKDPNVIFMPHILPLIQQMNPYLKMILFLRNPIDRAYSAWHMFNTKYISSKDVLKSFEDKINEELDYRINEPLNYRISNSHYLQRGLYYKQIKELLRYFPRENIYICLSEKVINEMESEYKKIYDFLDIEYPKENINYEKKCVGIYNSKDKNSDISPEFYKKLVKYYENDVKQLEKEILGYKTNWFTK